MLLSQQGFLFGEVESPHRLQHHSDEDRPGKYTLNVILLYQNVDLVPYILFLSHK